MAIRVSPTEPNPTHDISLTDGTTTIGLHLCNGQGVKDRRAMRQVSTPKTSLQIQQGDPDYSGFNLPYTPTTQKDWSGGRGESFFRRDTTRYYDAYQVDTRFGDIILAPARVAQTGYYSSQSIGAGADATYTHPNTVYGVASQFSASSTYTMRSVSVRMHRATAGTSIVNVYLFSDSGSNTPNAQLAYSVSLNITETTATDYVFPLVYALTSGVVYWVAVFDSTNDGQLVLTYDTSEAGYFIETTDSGVSAWTTLYSNQALTFSVRNVGAGRVFWGEYKGTEIALFQPDDNSAPSIFANGHHAMATSNAGDKFKLKTGSNLSAAQLTNTVAKIVAGPGFVDDQTWRTVNGWTTTGTNDYITVNQEWGTDHTAATEWVTMGENVWFEITGHGLTGPVTDFLVYDDVMYFAQGENVNIRRARWTAGAWTWTDDGTNKATFLRLIPTTSGTQKMWAAKKWDSTIWSAPAVAWGSNLTFTQANGGLAVGNPRSHFTGMCAYGNPLVPWIFKEDGFGSIQNDVYAEVPVSELHAATSEENGRASVQHGVYLWFSLGRGFDRYYDGRLDDLGPDRDDGLPAARQGPISSAISYPGGVIVSVDGGATGVSSILFYNEIGWHELYRADAGARIRSMNVQVIPGDQPDRLWFCQGQDIYYLPITWQAPRKQAYPYYIFQLSGYLITSWYQTGFGDIVKFWKSLSIYSELLDAGHRVITVSYQTDSADDDSAWTALPSTFDTSPSQEVLLSDTYDVTSKRIRFKITLSTDANNWSPRIIATTLNAVTRVPPSKQWGITFQADDVTVDDAEGGRDALDMDGLLAQLETWADSDTQAAPLTLRSVIPQYDNKRVFLDSPNITLREVSMFDDRRDVKSIGSLSLTEA